MEELTFIENFLVTFVLLLFLSSQIFFLYAQHKSFQKLRINKRYIKVLERKIKEGD